MTTTIQKWGNSLGVRLTSDIVKALRLVPGSRVFLRADERSIFIEPRQSPRPEYRKSDWTKFVIPANKSRENVSGAVDKILYYDYEIRI